MLWWIGNALLAFVVVPLVVYLANRLIRLTLEIKHYADDVLIHGVALTGTLDAVPKLVKTKELTGAASQLVGRYGAAAAVLLDDSANAESSRPVRSVRLAARRVGV
ncbi:MAG: hypothetical protein ABIV94_02850 [Acidimicrobiales bacterium]